MRKTLTNSLTFLALVLAALCAAAQTAPPELTPSLHTPFRFVAYGDTRFTDPADTKAANPQVRLAIVKGITAAHPSFISIGGDIAYNGDKAGDWKVYDEETAVWKQQNIAVYPLLGNHDLHGDPKLSLANYSARYPGLAGARYYSVRAANMLMLNLDSNLDLNSGAQFDWLKSKLAAIGPEVEFIILAYHHPSYTSSSDDKAYGGGHSARPSEQQFAKFIEEQQTHMRARIVVFNGHVHNYEHHLHGGIHYFVTGGGGAHAYPISRGADDLFRNNEINYHFILVEVAKGKLTATMHRIEIKDGREVWTTPDTITITVPPAAPAGLKVKQ